MGPRCPPLGVVEGSTENKAVVRHLVAGLRDRGLDVSESVLLVLDGRPGAGHRGARRCVATPSSPGAVSTRSATR
jgi:hypothetical protein